MDPIQKLIDDWREKFISPQFTNTSSKTLLAEVELTYADYLDCWQQIDKDKPETWPEEDQKVINVSDISGEASEETFTELAIRFWHGEWWRPLLPIDTPPEG